MLFPNENSESRTVCEGKEKDRSHFAPVLLRLHCGGGSGSFNSSEICHSRPSKGWRHPPQYILFTFLEGERAFQKNAFSEKIDLKMKKASDFLKPQKGCFFLLLKTLFYCCRSECFYDYVRVVCFWLGHIFMMCLLSPPFLDVVMQSKAFYFETMFRFPCILTDMFLNKETAPIFEKKHRLVTHTFSKKH